MKQICDDLLKENEELATVVASIRTEQWSTPTPFYTWTLYDEIAHLHWSDLVVLEAMQDPEAFKHVVASFNEDMQRGVRIADVARKRLGPLAPEALFANWRSTYRSMLDAFSGLDAKTRIPWFGPDMSARSSATARLMETWAHGQDIYDTLRLRHPSGNRLRHIAHIGVSTFGWTFVNRHLSVPEIAPRVELTSPSGAQWNWNEASSEHYVRGSAEDFCLVVTQRRNVTDTFLRCAGSGAAWLAIAQCFAGPVAQPPAPGVRAVKY